MYACICIYKHCTYMCMCVYDAHTYVYTDYRFPTPRVVHYPITAAEDLLRLGGTRLEESRQKDRQMDGRMEGQDGQTKTRTDG